MSDVSKNASVAHFDSLPEGGELPDGPGLYEVENDNPLQIGKRVVSNEANDWFVYADSVATPAAEVATDATPPEGGGGE